ncbi:hypothetical protein MNB_SV-12-1704 [hydrothermal vent metagenome]|uniref:Uncharacterized protein n=1 Tax=hydrothermal vent metagenome TaxID=652676 RepID=A0A1W1CB83_9ZZZZ
MKLLLSLIIVGATLFAGGDIKPMRVYKPKVYKPKVYKPVVQKHVNCYKPNIKKCPDCEDVAELCPYNGEDLPLAQTEPCEGLRGR